MKNFENKTPDPSHSTKEYLYNHISSLGSFFSLSISFDSLDFNSELKSENIQWVKYNKNKTWSRRYGLSLYSLNGETSGEIDLNSILEWNRSHGTQYNELSFRQPTKYWKHFHSISSQLENLQDHLGRSHLLKLDEGGMFPPHRDNYREGDFAFRLLSFFNCSPSALHLNLDGQYIKFQSNKLYFLNTRLTHSLVSFQPEAIILILNVELNKQTVQYILENIEDC